MKLSLGVPRQERMTARLYMAISSSSNSSSSTLRNLTNATNDLRSAFEKLSSGKRINRAKDDAAGLAIVSQLEADISITKRAINNGGDAISISNVAESALAQVGDITTRQQELATQAANGVYSDEQRANLDSEYQALEQEKNRILSSTTFNGQSVFEGNSIQVGSDSGANSQINLPSVDAASLLSPGSSIASAANARAALDDLKAKSDTTSSLRSEFGAANSRIEQSISNNQTKVENEERAASQIRDVDVADEAAKSISARIRQQSSQAVLAQGNLTAQSVLKLLG